MKKRVASFVSTLSDELERRADPATKEWWERYLKGEAAFRGVKMAAVRSVVASLWVEADLEASPVEDVLDLAHECMRQKQSEDKLAGVLLLAEHALDKLRLQHCDALAQPLADGSLADWNVVDWYCVKVLGPFITAGADCSKRAYSIASWRMATSLWQRRASTVAFVNHASAGVELFTGFTDLLLKICEANAADPARWTRTSVGWLLRELSKHKRGVVQRFVEQHVELSKEARKNALKYM